jgi:hypothetical protein
VPSVIGHGRSVTHRHAEIEAMFTPTGIEADCTLDVPADGGEHVKLSDDGRRALELLARSSRGCAEAVLMAHGFQITVVGWCATGSRLPRL